MAKNKKQQELFLSCDSEVILLVDAPAVVAMATSGQEYADPAEVVRWIRNELGLPQFKRSPVMFLSRPQRASESYETLLKSLAEANITAREHNEALSLQRVLGATNNNNKHYQRKPAFGEVLENKRLSTSISLEIGRMLALTPGAQIVVISDQWSLMLPLIVASIERQKVVGAPDAWEYPNMLVHWNSSARDYRLAANKEGLIEAVQEQSGVACIDLTDVREGFSVKKSRDGAAGGGGSFNLLPVTAE